MIETHEMQSLLDNLRWLQQRDSFEKSDVVDVLDEIFDILLKMNKMEHTPSPYPYGRGCIVRKNEE